MMATVPFIAPELTYGSAAGRSATRDAIEVERLYSLAKRLRTELLDVLEVAYGAPENWSIAAVGTLGRAQELLGPAGDAR